MKTRTSLRSGSVYVEILVAVGIFALMLIPLLAGFQTGVRQTRILKSHASARYLAEWALSQARALVHAGLFEDQDCGGSLFADLDLSADARAAFPLAAAQLGELQLTRQVECRPITGGSARTRLYSVQVTVRWKDPQQPQTKELTVRAMEGEEI